mgnify:CR=1 FL=1
MTEKRIAILGSTGSIGRQALEIIAAEPRFRACALSAGGNWQLLAEQARYPLAENLVAGEENLGTLILLDHRASQGGGLDQAEHGDHGAAIGPADNADHLGPKVNDLLDLFLLRHHPGVGSGRSPFSAGQAQIAHQACQDNLQWLGGADQGDKCVHSNAAILGRYQSATLVEKGPTGDFLNLFDSVQDTDSDVLPGTLDGGRGFTACHETIATAHAVQ